MKTIKLKGQLDSELLSIGLKEGDIVHADPDTFGKKGAMYFNKLHNGFTHSCVVWPDNYVILNQKCSWCGKNFEGTGFTSGEIVKKVFCSDVCHRSDYEHYHDNCFSDADPGL